MKPVTDPGLSGTAATASTDTNGSRRPAWLPSVTTQIFIGLVLGVAIGHFWPALGIGIKPLADAFLRMIKMIIAPLLFSTLVVGIAGMGDLKAMGRIGLKAIIYFEAATTIALVIGLAMVNIFQPGAGLAAPVGADTSQLQALAANQQRGWDIFLHLFPTSVIDSMAKGDILQMVVFATFFGIALAAIGEGTAGDRRARRGRAHDVQVHRLRDAVRADRRDGGHRRDGRRARPADSAHAQQTDPDDVSRAGDFRAGRVRRRRAADSRADHAVHARGPRAGADRVHHRPAAKRRCRRRCR